MIGTGEKLLTRRDLRRRGWTDRVIADFLPEPDEIRDNPHVWTAPPMKLYRRPRVEALELKPEVREALDLAAKRKVAAGKASMTKKSRLVDAVAAMPPPAVVLEITGAEVMNAALERLALRYLIDELGDYKRTLAACCTSAGIEDRDRAVKAKLLDVIASAQPWLAQACAKEKERLSTS